MKQSTRIFFWGLLSCVLLSPLQIRATELVWSPVNPSFGGSPFNGDWLLASAQAQNNMIESKASQTSDDLLSDFQNRLNSQILYKLSDNIINEAYGEDSLIPEGQDQTSFNTGAYHVNISTDLSGINVRLTDQTTGNITTVSVPYF